MPTENQSAQQSEADALRSEAQEALRRAISNEDDTGEQLTLQAVLHRLHLFAKALRFGDAACKREAEDALRAHLATLPLEALRDLVYHAHLDRTDVNRMSREQCSRALLSRAKFCHFRDSLMDDLVSAEFEASLMGRILREYPPMRPAGEGKKTRSRRAA